MSPATLQGTVLQWFTQQSVNYQTSTITVKQNCRSFQPPLAITVSLSSWVIKGSFFSPFLSRLALPTIPPSSSSLNCFLVSQTFCGRCFQNCVLVPSFRSAHLRFPLLYSLWGFFFLKGFFFFLVYFPSLESPDHQLFTCPVLSIIDKSFCMLVINIYCWKSLFIKKFLKLVIDFIILL